ncbi:MAG: MqnA/MqnD/SBP family protein [Gammaproteobacteria bacterium]
MNAPATIVITPYLNSRAFVHHGPPPGCRLRALAPRDAGPAILRGEVLAGLVPVGGLADLGSQVELLGEYGIACPGPSRSVLFCSRVPFAEIDATTTVRLSADSMSSVRLLYLLLTYRGGSLPRFVSDAGDVDGELVIGDAALRMAGDARYPHRVDLAEGWQARHGLPMVFARWVIDRRATRAQRAQLAWWLRAYAAHAPALLDRAAAECHAAVGLSVSDARDYLDGIRTSLRGEDLAGQARYLAELSRLDLPPWLASSPRVTRDFVGGRDR